MKVLLDVNIWLDIAARPKHFPDSIKLYQHLEGSGHAICMAACSYTTTYFLLKKLIGVDGAQLFLISLANRAVRFLPFTEEDIAIAHKLRFTDHEDACVAASALNSGCDILVTRNLRDFRHSPVSVKTPSQLLSTK